MQLYRYAARGKTAAKVGRAAADDDESAVRIPYGDASGAALALRDVMLSVADTDLLNDGCVTVMKGQVVGLVGGNGCGKSTLLKCIAGVRAVDDGAIAISSDLEVGYFEQTSVSGSLLTVYQEARARMTRINAAEAQLAAAEALCESGDVEEACKGADAYMSALEEFDAAGGNGAEKRIAGVLDGLGFARSQWDVVCDDLSGGWQMRVALGGAGAIVDDGRRERSAGGTDQTEDTIQTTGSLDWASADLQGVDAPDTIAGLGVEAVFLGRPARVQPDGGAHKKRRSN
jgi:ABC-type dipeptide/oligopeptide/nickel transport system ATPase subunit